MENRTNEEKGIIVWSTDVHASYNRIEEALGIKLLRNNKYGPLRFVNSVLIFSSLTGLVQFLFQVTFTIAMHLWFVLIHTVLLCDSLLIQHIPTYNTQLYHTLKA